MLAANDVAYLDNSATTQKPACVIEAERDFYLKHNANPLRGLYDLAMQATDIYEDARVAVQKFINAKSEQEIIFTRNTTESLNLVAYSYGLANLKPVMKSLPRLWSITATCCPGAWLHSRPVL